LFSGTLAAIVTMMAPITYTMQPASTHRAAGACHPNPAQAATARQASAVPNTAAMNNGVTARRLIDCIAATARRAGSRFSAGMTKLEKAKNAPATSPHPRAVPTTTARRPPLTGLLPITAADSWVSMAASQAEAGETVHGLNAQIHTQSSMLIRWMPWPDCSTDRGRGTPSCFARSWTRHGPC
jgi:hypothetical protein